MGSESKFVLVVEDDDDIRRLVCTVLQMNKHRVESAADGEEALGKLFKMPELPNLIFLDLMMPVMDGFTFREKQLEHKDFSRIPVVIMSADGHVQEKKAKLQATDYIQKPITIAAIVNAVEEHSTECD